MAHHKSAVKRNRQSLKRHERNQQSKSALRTQIKKLREAIETKNAESVKQLLPQTIRVIDKAGSKGLIHPRTASRNVARLSKAVSEFLSSAQS